MSEQPLAEKESLTKQVAALALSGTSNVAIAQTLGITRYAVEKIRKSTEFKALLKDLGDRAVEAALNSFKTKMEELEPLAFEALKANLKDKKLDAVRVWGEFVGVKDRKDDNKGDAPIQIILPGSDAPKDIKVESRNLEDES